MYRLMIVDDEDEERIGIRFLLNKFGFSFEIEEAADGREALGKMGDFEPDILFTDVKMPFVNGIQLATEIRQEYPGLPIIFFSGYDDFEYVKQALSLQAVDYILKPVDPGEFMRTISTVLERLQDQEEQDSRTQYFHRHFLLSRLLNGVSLQKLEAGYGSQELDVLRRYTRLILLEFDGDFFGKEVTSISDFAGLFQEILPCPYEFLDINPSQGVFFLQDYDPDPDCVRKIAQCIHLTVEKQYGWKGYLAVSEKLDHPDQIGPAFERTEESLGERFFYKDSYVYPMDANGQEKGSALADDGQLLQAIEQGIICRDMAGVRKDVEILMDKCRSNGFQSYIYTRFVCANLLKLICQSLPSGKERLAGLVEQLYSCTRFADAETMIRTLEDELEQQLEPDRESPRHMIQLVEQYIREHYEDVLSLDILAEKVYLTPHYLSSIFIQEKGVGINKYIKTIRMDKARELLMKTNRKISDICIQVGYTNVSYFCRSFRNEYGVTPDQYRRQDRPERTDAERTGRE